MATKSEKQLIQELLINLENRNEKNAADLFQELLTLLKKNSKIILQYVSDNLDKFLGILENDIETGEINPTVFTCYGFLSHHESISKLFTSIHVERFFRTVLKQTNLSKKSLSLAVWCLGVQRFSTQTSAINTIEPHSTEIFKSIHIGIKNPYQSHTTTVEALNTLLVLLNQLQEISVRYVTLWFVDVIECLISPHKNVCIAAEKITEQPIFRNMLPFSNNTKFKISDKDLNEISNSLFESVDNYQNMLKQNLNIPLYELTQIQMKPIPSNAYGSSYSWNQILPDISNRQQIIALKAWGYILYFLQKNISKKDNLLSNLNEILKPKLLLKPDDSQSSSQSSNKASDIVNSMIVYECLENSWTMLIQLLSSHSKIHSKGRLPLLLKPLLAPLRQSAQGILNPADRKVREICYQKIIQYLLPETDKDIGLFFEQLLKPLFTVVSSKETLDYVLQEQLVLFLSQWFFNDQRDNSKVRKKKNEDLSQDDTDDDTAYRYFVTGSTFINDISFLVRKDFAYLFSSPCLKQDSVFLCPQNGKASSAIQKLELFTNNFKVFFDSFFRKLVAGFVKNFTENVTDQTLENSRRFSKSLNFYFRSLCQVVVSYLRYCPKDLKESEIEKYSTLLLRLITNIVTFCIENIFHYCTTDTSPHLEEWIFEISSLFIKSFVECMPVNFLIAGTCNSIKVYLDLKDITAGLSSSFSIQSSHKKSPFFAVFYCLYKLAFQTFNDKPHMQCGEKICDLINSITTILMDRLLVDLPTLPNLYNEPVTYLLQILVEDMILTHQEVCVVSKLISTETQGLTKLLECQMCLWKRLCGQFRNEIRTIDTCFSLMISKNTETNLPNTSTETLQKRKKQAQELKTYLCKQNPENQKQSDSNLTGKILTPEFLTLLEKLLFFPFELFGCKMVLNNSQMTDDLKKEFSVETHHKAIHNLLSNDSEILHTMKEILMLFGNVTANTNMPPFHYISKHLKSNLSHHHLHKLTEDLLEKLNCQYLCIISELEKEESSGAASTSYLLMRSWILFGTKLLSLLCTLCHESQRFKVSILSIPSGKSTIHNLQLLLKTFVWMIFDYRRQFSGLSDNFFDLITQLMSELKNILTLSRSAQHTIQFAQEYAEEILFDKDFTTLFELQGSFLSKKTQQTIVYSTEEMLQFASLCENIWESVFNQISKWCLQDGVVFDQNMLNQMEKVLVIGLDSKRNSKVRKITTQFWSSYFSQSKTTFTYSPSLKQVFSVLIQRGDISKTDLPNFPFEEDVKPQLSSPQPPQPSEASNKRKRVEDIQIKEEIISSTTIPISKEDDSETSKKKVKLTKSQKEKIRERKDTRIVVPEMNPSLLSSSLLSIDDSDDENDTFKPPKDESSKAITNISDIVSAPKTIPNGLNDSSMLEIKDIPATPRKEPSSIGQLINLVTPEQHQKLLELSPIPHLEKIDDKETTSSVEDLFNKLESGCTPTPKDSGSCSITFTAQDNQVMPPPKTETKCSESWNMTNATPEKSSVEDDETQITQTSTQKPSPAVGHNMGITPILKKSPLKPNIDNCEKVERRKQVRFVSDQNLTFTEHVNALESLVNDKNIDELFSSKEEKTKAAQKLNLLLGKFLKFDE